MAAAAPAALSLRSCAGLAPSRADRPSSFQKKKKSAPPPLLSSRRGGRRVLYTSSSFSSTRAVSVGSPPQAEQEGLKKFHFLVANAKFMLDEEEHFREQLFEKLRYYGERTKEQDFWLVIEPKFLEKFPAITKRLKRPAVALVSTDATWITFMKLRLDRVLADSFEAGNLGEALASNPVELQFEKPEKWVAPYPKYESGWWKTFQPPETSKTLSQV
ncbi:Uncharacterized protein M6B38_247735 [Iris pallida]|uniref:Ycf54 n=1 Tax=Iris pallida TaxID=29817 RepID=A0AAX6DG58_IRIPA|nr:Uncharacterized protein M6B38_247735 [Iris pallida]